MLIRCDGREHLLLIGPEGATVIESAIVRDALDVQVDYARLAAAVVRRAAAEEATMRARAQLASVGSRVLARVGNAVLRLRHALRRSRVLAGFAYREWLSQPNAFAVALAEVGSVQGTLTEACALPRRRTNAIAEPPAARTNQRRKRRRKHIRAQAAAAGASEIDELESRRALAAVAKSSKFER